MVDVVLAGYNVDNKVISDLKDNGWDGAENITPETIAAAYARISRDPMSVTELRADSREEVDKARSSNQNIVFKMCHHSVAEHAYLNFDVLGISRLAIEALEEARLCSYTEKSQRYITLDGDFIIPAEFKGEDKKLFLKIMNEQVQEYNKLFPILHEYQKKLHPEMIGTKSGQVTVEGWAKEDARYTLGMAVEGQLGFSANARNLEHIIRKLKHNPLAEVRELSQKLYDEAKEVCPSLIVLSDPEEFKKQFGTEVSEEFLKNKRKTFTELAEQVFSKYPSEVMENLADMYDDFKFKDDVKLLHFEENADEKVIAALLQSHSKRPYEQCYAVAKEMDREDQENYIKKGLTDLTMFDGLPREFEFPNFEFEVVLSSSAFAQMKRHRPMTMTTQQYDPELGYTYPESVVETGQKDSLKKLLDKTSDAYVFIKKMNPEAAQYVLTNAHRRRVLINADLREMYHIARLRMDGHAQWDIRKIAGDMVDLVKQQAPATAILACGKDQFEEKRKDVYE